MFDEHVSLDKYVSSQSDAHVAIECSTQQRRTTHMPNQPVRACRHVNLADVHTVPSFRPSRRGLHHILSKASIDLAIS
jgi:hypothetical protein